MASLFARLSALGSAPATEVLPATPSERRAAPSWSWGPSFRAGFHTADASAQQYDASNEASVHMVFAGADVDALYGRRAAPGEAAERAPAQSSGSVRERRGGGAMDGASASGRSGSRRGDLARTRASEDVQSAIAVRAWLDTPRYALPAQKSALVTPTHVFTCCHAPQDRDRALASKLAHRTRGLTQPAPRRSAVLGDSPAQQAPGCPGVRCTGVARPLFAPWLSARLCVRAWEQLLVCLSLWSALEAPYRLAFGAAEGTHPPSRRLESGALAVDLLFCIDVVLRAAVVVLPAGAPSDVRRGAASVAYLTSWQLPADLLAALPLDMVAAAAAADQRVHFSLGVLRLLRLQRVAAAFAAAEADTSVNYSAVRILKFLLIILMQCHLFACIMYFVAICEPRFEDTWFPLEASLKPGGVPSQPLRRYLFALYWATTTLASVGYGDTSPVSDAEFLVGIVFMISNIGLFAYVVGNMTVLATQADESTRLFRVAFRDLEAYMTLNGRAWASRACVRVCALTAGAR
jgi:hypothetical protein